MAEYSGTNLYVIFGSTVLSGDYRRLTTTESMDLVDASAGSDTGTTHVSTLTNGQATYEAVAQTDGTVMWAAVANGTSGTLEWAPEGTASGKQKHTVTAIVSSRENNIGYNDVVTLTVNFQFSDNAGVAESVY